MVGGRLANGGTQTEACASAPATGVVLPRIRRHAGELVPVLVPELRVNPLPNPPPQGGREQRRTAIRLQSTLACTALLFGLAAGCGTTRMTDTQRTATEQLLVSKAIDQAVMEVDFSELTGKPVFFDTQYLDGAVDRGYLVSSLRQQLLFRGCLLQEDRNKATYVVEVRSGGIGTDRHALLVGIPQMNVPAFMPGQPSQIPEIPLAKKTDQEGVAKLAIFAYNRLTGQLVWQSGVVKATSTSKDTWVFGAGPFQQGSIRSGTELAGEPLPRLFEKGDATGEVAPAVAKGAVWPEPATDSKRLAYLLANAPANVRSIETGATGVDPLADMGGLNQGHWPWNSIVTEEAAAPVSPPTPSTKAPAPSPPPNVQAQLETEPSGIVTSGLGTKPGNPLAETEPRIILDFAGGTKPES
jgi:hypothetical protein